ncbi:IS3 family transposase [Ruminococcus champanellensis]|uniref:IS3 family transposase n=1 Tax=Ruminococcus champanellensis TaxID=1161942 RepID=UPI000B10CCCC
MVKHDTTPLCLSQAFIDLKKEETDRRTYSSFEELNLSIFQYIHGFYNSFRPHSHNNELSPNQAEMTLL